MSTCGRDAKIFCLGAACLLACPKVSARVCCLLRVDTSSMAGIMQPAAHAAPSWTPLRV